MKLSRKTDRFLHEEAQQLVRHSFHSYNTIQPKTATCRDETTTGEAVGLCRVVKTRGTANDNSCIYLCFTNDGVRTYSYDAADRLIRINYVGNATKKGEFGYDGLGRRITQTETPTTGAAVTTRNLWCGSRLCQERTSADVVTARYYPEGERRPVAVEAYVYMPDSLGSVRELVGAGSGILKFAYDYDAYGKPTRSWTNVSSADTKFRYAGLMYHAQSGLYLSTTRAYDPTRGKWINRDPIREAGGINLYGYVGGNPINAIDPLGTEFFFAIDEPPIWTGLLRPKIGEIRTPPGKTPLEELPPGSAGGAGAGKRFPYTKPDPENMPKCAYCGKQTRPSDKPCPDRMNRDHIIPKVGDGNNSPENELPACQSCNLSKGNRTPEKWYDDLLNPSVLPMTPIPAPSYGDDWGRACREGRCA